MIDAHAVVAELEKLRDLPSGAGSEALQRASLEWLRTSLQPLPVTETTDAAGNAFFTLPGTTDRTVVMGSTLRAGGLDSRLGVVTGLETLKGLARRYQGPPPCGLQLAVWAGSPPEITGLTKQKVSAYLELHVEPGTRLEQAGTPLGVATTLAAGEPVAFNPRLMSLCEEAIRELTGTSATLSTGSDQQAAVAVARSGIPAGVMYVQSSADAEGRPLSESARLHLLQAAEAFGRWTEATVHLLAGEDVDLWALEHRVPHS